MSESGNVKTVQAAYEAFRRGDIPAVLRSCADDIEWIVPGPREAPHAGRRRGVDEVRRFFGQVAETVEFTAFEPREYVAQGHRVVALGHYEGRIRTTGRPFASDWAMVWTVRDGKAVAFQEYTDTQSLGLAYH